MTEPQLMGYKSSKPENGDLSSSEVDRGMDMSYSPVHTDSEGSPSKLPPVEIIDAAGRNGTVDKMKNGHSEKLNGAANPDSDEKDKDKKEEVKMVGTFELFRFAGCLDIFLMIVGTLGACIHGAALPAMILVFGPMVDSFVDSGKLARVLGMAGISFENYTSNPAIQVYIENTYNITRPPDLLSSMREFAIYYIIIACAVIVVGYLQVSMWATAAERQTKLIRIKFFRSILRQQIGWFDTHETGELNTRLSDDIGKIREGIGDKVGSFFQWFSAFLAGFIIGFVRGWKLTLVILAVSPLLVFAAFLMSKLAANMTNLELKAYAKAGAVAEEVISSIRTVVSFGGQQKEYIRYNGNLVEARDTGVKKSLITGLCMGFIWFAVFGSYALGFWYGSKLIIDEPVTYTSGNVLIVFFSVIIGAFSLGNAAPSLQSLATGRGAAYSIYNLIDQVPEIDSSSDEGLKPESVSGQIKFNNIHFTYPSRLESKVLQGLSFGIDVGQTVALVGASGSGKSTTVQLIQRFYDPADGQVLVDNLDVREYNICCLRQNIGVVSQEPVLFGTTIAENIRYGRLDISQEQIEVVAKQANAHNFIMELPNKYETLVGERGAQLSGGQKQRVAIARALARNPKILLLDEATSALDMESESIVQEALEKASHGRTTIVIAHRLSTVRGADKIVGIREGVAVEQGTHDELMKINDGVYCNLVTQQTKHFESGEDELEEFEEEIKHPISPNHELKRLTSAGSIRKGKSAVDTTKEEEDEKLPDPPMKRVMRMNAPEWLFILCGCLAALINGGVQPAFAILFAEILGVWSKDPSEQPPLIMMYSLILLGLGVVSFFTMFLQGYMFGKSGEYLTMRIRQMAFKSILRQEIAYFDDHKNSTGALTTRLATDASQVQGATGARIGGMVQSVANIGTAIVIAFIYGWQLTLVILAFLPFIAIAGFIEMKILTGVGGKDKEALEDAGKVATEAIENIRTVASLTREPTFHSLYVSKILLPYKAALRKGHVYGLAFGFSQAIIFFAYAASFYYGAYLISVDVMNYTDVFKVFSAIVFGAMGLGQASAFAPDYAKAKTSASRLFALFDREPSIDSSSEEGEKPQEGTFTSSVRFDDVKFNYPTRPGVPVLRGFNINVNEGQTIALVGSSGCGKSTSVSLIERFYDPTEGTVHLDKYNLTDLNIQWLRRQVGIVSQEPVLFDCSIAENIAYGDNSRTVGMDEIVTAARNANIHNFIASLPNGYDTTCGDKGTQLSGGQKQRVAIARALVGNPKILLLDEATSALDTESEQIVQEALDKAREGRTCLVIAHRLSTIQNADKICVIHHGHVVEEGMHGELMAKHGFYHKLQMIQQRKL